MCCNYWPQYGCIHFLFICLILASPKRTHLHRGIAMLGSRTIGAVAALPVLAGTLLATGSPAAGAESLPAHGGQIFVPDSSFEAPDDVGVRAHTNIRFFVPKDGMDHVGPPSHNRLTLDGHANGVPAAGYYYLETPASLACVYNLVSAPLAGCNPYATTVNPSGGSRAIAIVDAYDDPTAASDLAYFSSQFGLPAANLTVVYASGRKPPSNSGWQVEEALDLEWAHAMAPGAKLYLVEAASANLSDLLTAVGVASQLVAKAGGGEVSMSWGGSEFSGETAYDKSFTTPGVVYLASAGDSPGVSWPAASPNVIAVGGTALSRNPNTGNFQVELAWQQTGGGPSAYEARPSFQSAVSATGAQRGTPDVAAVADPTTGVWVYAGGQWYIVGGTSVAAPVWAGVINAAGRFAGSSAAELTAIYGNASGFTNVTDGDCGPNEGYLALGAWSFCTGHGSPNGGANK
jgi:kumamolisin